MAYGKVDYGKMLDIRFRGKLNIFIQEGSTSDLVLFFFFLLQGLICFLYFSIGRARGFLEVLVNEQTYLGESKNIFLH